MNEILKFGTLDQIGNIVKYQMLENEMNVSRLCRRVYHSVSICSNEVICDCQNEDKFRRRQEKRDQLMRKRKDMEDRLKEEAIKMAELTESAKKKGETKFMSEEARRDAEERIQVEAEVIARLEHQAADMARTREKIQRDLAKISQEKATEIEKQAIAALQAKRALVDAQIKQEEEEIKSASEAAKREASVKA